MWYKNIVPDRVRFLFNSQIKKNKINKLKKKLQKKKTPIFCFIFPQKSMLWVLITSVANAFFISRKKKEKSHLPTKMYAVSSNETAN